MAKFKETKRKEATEKFKIGDTTLGDSKKQVSELTKISDIIGKLEVTDDTDLKIIDETTKSYKKEGDRAQKEIQKKIDGVDSDVKSVNKEIAGERKKVEQAKRSADSMRKISDIGASAAEKASAEFGKSAMEYSKMEDENAAKIREMQETQKAYKNAIDGLF